MYKYLFTLSVLVFLFSSHNVAAQNCNSNPPYNLSVTNISSCSATFNWQVSNSVKWVKISYRITGGTWSSWIKVTGETSYLFSNLLANTSYDFKIFSKCSDGTKSSKIKLNGTYTLACTLPSTVALLEQKTKSLEFAVSSSCSFDSVHIKYSTLTGSPSTVSFATANSYLIDGLTADTKYLFQFSTCPLSFNSYTTADTFSTTSLPNIILILVDDARNDYASIGGAPPFVQTPNIDRIGNEGADFRNAFVATSLCAPSRATIATGLFTNKTGVYDNINKLDTSFVTIPEVLRNNGYYTALVGKNHGTFGLGSSPEFDFVMASSGSGSTFIYNGVTINLPAAYVLSVTDTAIGVIKRTTDPLFMWLAYRVPHMPHVSLPGFEGDYDTQIIPWKADTARYANNFPSFIYNNPDGLLHGYHLDTFYRNIMEDMAGLDSCIGEVLNTLEETGKLNNTLIIYTSDNGYLLGTHWLGGKYYSFDPSMRVPLLVRYPEWFSDSTVISNEFASNMDIAPTIYEAAQVNYTGEIDGKSLRKLYTGEDVRKSTYYLMKRFTTKNPTETAFRDQYFKYIKYSCNDTSEMFFDLVNDPLELTNQIYNSAYATQLKTYRAKYDSMKLAWNDTASSVVVSCYIQNPLYLKDLYDAEELDTDIPAVYPSLANEYAEIYSPWEETVITISNFQGQLLATWNLSDNFTRLQLDKFCNGIYFIRISSGEKYFSQKIIISH